MALPALIPVAAKALVASKARKLIGPAIAAAILAPALLVVVLFSAGIGGGCPDGESVSSSGSASLSETAKRILKPKFIPIYIDAAKRFKLGADGWAYLASIHGTENGFADSGGSPTSSAGAQGPMQFMPATWQTYQTDGDGDGKKDVQNVHDALFAAAKYLRASGAPADWQSAIFSYNHAQWYVDKIRAGATDYLGDGPSTTYASTTGGGGGGCTCGSGSGTGDTTLASDGGGGGGGGPLPAQAPEIRWPTAHRALSSPFGMRWGRLHAGVDIPMAIGTPLHAAAAGRVTDASWFGGYGNYTCIQHARTFTTCYAHQNKLGVHVGQSVAVGQVIGLSGNTGGSTGPHLHFEVRLGAGFAGPPVDPAPYLKGAQGPGPAGTVLAAGTAGCAPATQLAALEGGSLLWPTTERGKAIGFPYTGTHNLGNWQSDNAIDIAVPLRTPIVAVDAGTICASCGFGGTAGSGMGRFDGKRLTLNTTSGNQVFYGHLKSLAPGLKPGSRVKRGQVIGRTWSANGVPHLHIAVRDGNPLQLFGAENPARPAVAT